MKKRLFIAIELPNSVKEKLDIPLGDRLRTVKKENLHITVLFLGYIDENEIPEVSEIIRSVCEKNKRLNLKFDKVIFGPPGKPPRMIWALFEKNENYEKLNSDLYRGLRKFKPDKYNDNHIHLTLARFKKQLNGTEMENIKLPGVEPGELNADKIILIESILSPEGPEYFKIEQFFLGL